MPDRAGYQVSLYAIDVSSSMGEVIDDPTGSTSSKSKKTKLDYVKEFVARKCEPKITSGRKTEHVGMLSFGGKTNNQANRAYIQSNPEDEDPPYAAVACDVAIQTAKPKAVEVVMNLEVGSEQGNPVSALMVALDMIQTHQHTKSWALEVVLVTDGESGFRQDEYEDAMTRLDELGVKLTVVGIGFTPGDDPVDKAKSRNKRLSEKFWRTFIDLLHDKVSATTDSPDMLPDRQVFDEALAKVRLPRPTVVNGTVSGIDLHIGSDDVNPDQAIKIPIKYSKATMKARPPSLSKAWKAAVDLQGPQPGSGNYRDMGASQLMASVNQQSQGSGSKLDPSDIAAMISAEVKSHSTYVVKKQDSVNPTQGTQATQGSQAAPSQKDPDFVDADADQEMDVIPEEAEDEYVSKEDIVKAWRFGSTWVPMEADMFEPLVTNKGVEILNLIPTANIKRWHLIGEVRYVWPDTTSAKAQIQFASLIEAMKNKNMSAVVRWVLKDQAEPVIGICVPMHEFPGEGKRIDYMFWVKLPFAEDEHQFWFPSLTSLKTEGGKVVKEHPLLPTKEQSTLMDELVQEMDLDVYAAKQVSEDDEDEEEDDKKLVMDRENDKPRWFETTQSFNPVIHRIKEAIFHASLASDLDSDPLPPPHPELTKYFDTPDEIAEGTAKLVSQLKDALNIKKVPPKQRKKFVKEGLGEEEGFIDIDDLFNENETERGVKPEPTSPKKAAPATQQESDSKPDIPASPIPHKTKPKPKKGRLVSNEAPLEDFQTLIEGEGDVFRKAIQDLGQVVKENVAASFSRQAFPLAIECLKSMRETALMYEEVETYNEYLQDLEKYVKDPDFKHNDFWDHFEKANIGAISDEEARQALEEE